MTTTIERIDETGTRPANVVEALSLVMADVREVGKTGQYSAGNTRYNFRGVDAVVNAVGPVLRRHGVVVVPHHVEATYGKATSSGGSAMREVTVTVDYRFYGPGGLDDFLPIQSVGESLDVSDKGTAKAMSVAYRVALLQALCLPTDAADPDSEHHERAAEPVRDEAAVARWISGFAAKIDGADDAVLDGLFYQGKEMQDSGFITRGEAIELAQRMTARRAALQAEKPTAAQEHAEATGGGENQ